MRSPAFMDKVTRLCDHVIYVTGNHEYFGSSPEATHRSIRSYNRPNFHFLNNEEIEIDGVLFAGSTLWYREAPSYAERWMPDFHYIEDFKPWVWEENKRALDFFGQTKADVWVMHHLPSPKSVKPRWRDSPINCYFLCDIEEEIKRSKPRLVMHGHTHEKCFT